LYLDQFVHLFCSLWPGHNDHPRASYNFRSADIRFGRLFEINITALDIFIDIKKNIGCQPLSDHCLVFTLSTFWGKHTNEEELINHPSTQKRDPADPIAN
jgi:hypothetical protein